MGPSSWKYWFYYEVGEKVSGCSFYYEVGEKVSGCSFYYEVGEKVSECSFDYEVLVSVVVGPLVPFPY